MGKMDAYYVEFIIMLNNRVQKTFQDNELFAKLFDKTDYKTLEPYINIMSEEMWKWFVDISNPKNFIEIDLKEKS